MPSEEELRMVQINGYYIQYCTNSGDRDYGMCCIEAVKQNGLALKYIDPLHQTDELCIMAIKNNYQALKYVSIPQTYKMCILSLYKSNGKSSIIKMIKNQEINIFCEVLKKYPMEIKYVASSKSYAQLCMVALKRNGLALMHVDKLARTSTMYYVAINNNGLAIKYISPSEQNETLGLIALRQNVKSIKYIRNRTSEMWTFALRKNGLMIKYFDEEDFVKYKFSQEKLRDMFLTLLQIAVGQNKMALALSRDNRAFDFINMDEVGNKNIDKVKLLICNKKSKTKRIIVYADNLFDAILGDMIKLCNNNKMVENAIEQHKMTDIYEDYANNHNLCGYYFCRNRDKTKYVIIFKPNLQTTNTSFWINNNNERRILHVDNIATQVIITYQIIL